VDIGLAVFDRSLFTLRSTGDWYEVLQSGFRNPIISPSAYFGAHCKSVQIIYFTFLEAIKQKARRKRKRKITEPPHIIFKPNNPSCQEIETDANTEICHKKSSFL
jgi:hypothetical protein